MNTTPAALATTGTQTALGGRRIRDVEKFVAEQVKAIVDDNYRLPNPNIAELETCAADLWKEIVIQNGDILYKTDEEQTAPYNTFEVIFKALNKAYGGRNDITPRAAEHFGYFIASIFYAAGPERYEEVKNAAKTAYDNLGKRGELVRSARIIYGAVFELSDDVIVTLKKNSDVNGPEIGGDKHRELLRDAFQLRLGWWRK
ncbi:hypothetical protein F4778DRAFT_782780 [Xylariomycetidae sp. FL2044]|nr:hypothetical protein F4778DRAFT_782780 [Xylariomycetidae sp. FL2044]